MNHPDPERLSSLTSNAELREVIRAGQGRVPDAAALERLRARLDSALGSVGAPSPSHAPTTLGVKAVAVTVIASVIVAALIQLGGPRPSEPAPSPRTRLGTVTATSEVPPTPTPVELPSATASIANSAAPPAFARKERPAPSTAPLAAASAPAAVVSTPSELELIGSAGRALKSDPARALALANEHQKLYPAGTLAEERELIAIEALARLGNGSLARTRADRFNLSFPRSAHLVRVSRAIAGSGDQKNEPPPALDQQ